jgi:hypothetical protein
MELCLLHHGKNMGRLRVFRDMFGSKMEEVTVGREGGELHDDELKIIK